MQLRGHECWLVAAACLLIVVVTDAAETGKRPNVLLIVTDQERAPPAYEPEELRKYRETYFHGRRKIAQNGVTLNNHYIASAACVASRACLYTGHHVDMHGVDRTNGLAKPNHQVQWLTPGWIPTMGDYFRSDGFDTRFVGKWHLSDEDIAKPGTDDPANIRNPDGSIDRTMESLYRDANLLDKFGFSNWTGPEPHGPLFENSGTVRDVEYTAQTVEWLKQRNASQNETPWMLAVNLVNPHDICLFQALVWYLFDQPTDDGKCPVEIPSPPTRNQDVSQLPSVYRQYIMAINERFDVKRRWVWTERDETCFYYYLQKMVDEHVDRIVSTLQQTRFFQDTIVVFTADHGELLGAHGGGIEKWYNAFEETVKVPMIISNPKLFPDSIHDSSTVTSHLDVLPTLLALAGIDQKAANEKLAQTHKQVQPLPGKNIMPSILSNLDGNEAKGNDGERQSVYFYTRDNVLFGDDNLRAFLKFFPEWLVRFFPGRSYYDALVGTTSVQAVVTHFKGGERFKLIEYFDEPEYWSTPFKENVYITRDSWMAEQELGAAPGTVIRRTDKLPSEFLLFDLVNDPNEENNLYSPDHPMTAVLLEELAQQRSRVLLKATEPIPTSQSTKHLDHSLKLPLPFRQKLEKLGWSILSLVTVALLYLLKGKGHG